MRTFSVKNFEKFQHYKDRAPPWIKLYNELLENYDFGVLPDCLKGQLIGIWLLASRLDNKLPFDGKWLASKINATDPIDLELLLDTGFIEPHVEGSAVGKRENWPSRYISDAIRAEVMERDGHKCVRCSSHERLEIDHIQPISQGGTGEKENLQVLCVSCNRKKRAEQLRSKVNAEPTQRRSLEREREREAEAEAEKIKIVARAPKDEKFEELRKAYPRRKGGDPGPPAAKLFLAAVKAGTDPQVVIDGAKRFAVEEAQNINTPYIPQLVKWLRDKRWLDYGSTNGVPVKYDIRSHLV